MKFDFVEHANFTKFLCFTIIRLRRLLSSKTNLLVDKKSKVIILQIEHQSIQCITKPQAIFFQAFSRSQYITDKFIHMMILITGPPIHTN